ncbi:hypothetical protein GP486_007675 [Trichoglossum hirsutum]|uniref:BTB domain-containing protein n=1 Tax=Trichoglossum hirsutum TaxID=265104 RepID=A0A9P8L4P9_9PEZI|nr:hypothetical protein GP486_007675 [Trichoglossum hirsutum]
MSGSGEVHLKEDDPDTVGRMVDYLYTLDYDDGTGAVDPEVTVEDAAGPSQPGDEQPLTVNVQVYTVAEKYGIAALKEHAASKFGQLVASNEVNEAFFAAIREVYSCTATTDRGLRDLVTQAAFSNTTKLMEMPEFISVLEEFGEFAIELLRMSAKKNDELQAAAASVARDAFDW